MTGWRNLKWEKRRVPLSQQNKHKCFKYQTKVGEGLHTPQNLLYWIFKNMLLRICYGWLLESSDQLKLNTFFSSARNCECNFIKLFLDFFYFRLNLWCLFQWVLHYRSQVQILFKFTSMQIIVIGTVFFQTHTIRRRSWEAIHIWPYWMETERMAISQVPFFSVFRLVSKSSPKCYEIQWQPK